jgi:hypothetical protein
VCGSAPSVENGVVEWIIFFRSNKNF